MEVNFFHFSDTPASERYFLSSGNVFLNEFYIPYGGDRFSVLRKPFSLFFSTSGSRDRKGFSVKWKLFSFIPCFFPVSGNYLKQNSLYIL